MRLIGTGIDFQSLLRINTLLSRFSPLRFAKRILTHNEIQLMMMEFPTLVSTDKYLTWDQVPQSQRRIVSYLGVRWALKEAVYKAMHPINVSWHQVCIHKSKGIGLFILGKPLVVISDHDVECFSSISHDSGFVVANCMIVEKSRSEIISSQ
jgi:holo-[acyl-carrier protein] synthase